MARGGFRPGSGRPGTKPVAPSRSKVKKTGGSKITKPVNGSTDMTPLDYMLAVMRDSQADEARRDKMAQCAAPYIHEKAAEKKLGKKEAREEAAKQSSNVYALNRNKIALVVDND